MAISFDLSLLVDNKMYFDPICGDSDSEYVKYKTIYLGIETNILAIDDRIDDFPNFATYHSFKTSNEDTQPSCEAPSNFKDFTATLYLGKIIFEKNKKGILAPKFIPSNLTDSSFEGLNTFWLNEFNRFARNTNKQLLPPKQPEFRNGDWEYDEVKKRDYKYLKLRYFRSKKNIVLTKEQIISYFTQLHQENTEFIANYIESINKNHGIKAYHLHDKIYDDLLSKGILQKDMFKWWSNAPKAPYKQAVLLTLDFLTKTNQPNHKILLYDELFFWYLVLSLKNFIVGFSASFCDENNLLFNAGAYKQYAHLAKKYRSSTKEVEFRNTMYGFDEYRRELFFGNNGGLMNVYDDYIKLQFLSPNQALFERGQPITPSPLGKYYFELSDNKGVYIEFFPRIYPSITNSPKGWSKEMMQKLDLKLE
ncbi:hypothetical protein [Helicobacter sp. T3_23-1059]